MWTGSCLVPMLSMQVLLLSRCWSCPSSLPGRGSSPGHSSHQRTLPDLGLKLEWMKMLKELEEHIRTILRMLFHFLFLDSSISSPTLHFQQLFLSSACLSVLGSSTPLSTS